MTWSFVGLAALLIGWDALVMGVTAYAVFWQGHSGWWFLLALCLLRGTGSSKGNHE